MNYEQGMLAYMLNTGFTEPSNPAYSIQDNNIIENQSLLKQIATELNVSGATLFVAGQLQAKSTSGELLNIFVTYGSYRPDGADDWRGYIAVVNTFTNEFHIITSYESGITLKGIKAMGQNEDGRFTLIENRDASLSSLSAYRFVIVNNFTTTGTLILKQSYNLPSGINLLTTFDRSFEKHIYKSPNSGEYVFQADSLDSLEGANAILITLKIEVGQSPEWNSYSYKGDYTYAGYKASNILPTWDSSGNLTVLLSGTGRKVVNNAVNTYYAVIKFNGGNFSKIFEDNVGVNTDAEIAYSQIISEEKSILCYSENTKNKKNTQITVYNNTLRTPLLVESTDTTDYLVDDFNIQTIGSETLIAFYDYSDSTSGNINLYRVDIDNILQNIYALLNTTFSYSYGNMFMVTKNYNLYHWNFSNTDTTFIGYELYNYFNYNGNAYYGTLCVSPHDSILYSTVSNKELPIFARNLYNKTINGALTVSTVQIPNMLLNNLDIQKEQLYSYANLRVGEFNDTLSKNVYETVNVNFNNTLSISNNNDVSNPLYNLQGASSLNTNASADSQANYDNIYLNKVRVNYVDGSQRTLTLDNTQKSLSPEGIASANITFSFVLSKKANSMELLSNDEQTVYCTYDISDLETNTIYKYNQEVVCNTTNK